MYRLCGLLLVATVTFTPCHASGIDIRLSVRELYDLADLVAVVHITGADSEEFRTWTYRAIVDDPIKGAKQHQLVYFGPAETHQNGEETPYKLRGEYLAFLTRSMKTLDQHRLAGNEPWFEHGQVPYYEIAFAIATVFPIEQICGDDACEWSVGMSSAYIKRPQTVDVLTLENSPIDLPADLWVSQPDFLRLLRTFGHEDAPAGETQR